MTWSDALVYASGPGVAAVIGVALSFVVEYWTAYTQLQPKQKRLVFIALSLAVPVLAATLRGLWGYVAWSWEGLYWPAILAGGTAYLTGQVAHLRKLPDAPEDSA